MTGFHSRSTLSAVQRATSSSLVGSVEDTSESRASRLAVFCAICSSTISCRTMLFAVALSPAALSTRPSSALREVESLSGSAPSSGSR